MKAFVDQQLPGEPPPPPSASSNGHHGQMAATSGAAANANKAGPAAMVAPSMAGKAATGSHHLLQHIDRNPDSLAHLRQFASIRFFSFQILVLDPIVNYVVSFPFSDIVKRSFTATSVLSSAQLTAWSLRMFGS